MLPVFFEWDPLQDTFVNMVNKLQKRLINNIEHEHDELFQGLGKLQAVFDFEPDRKFSNKVFTVETITKIDRIGYPLSIRVSMMKMKHIADMNI